MPRSLNDPVGLAPSTFSQTSQPVRADSTGAGTSGVPPSSRVTTGVLGPTGSRSRYRSMSPGQAAGLRCTRLTTQPPRRPPRPRPAWRWPGRSEEHTSELQSHSDLVCRLLLEKKKTKRKQQKKKKKKNKNKKKK